MKGGFGTGFSSGLQLCVSPFEFTQACETHSHFLQALLLDLVVCFQSKGAWCDNVIAVRMEALGLIQ